MAQIMKNVMKEIAISEFRAKCLAILEQVRLTKRPVRITRRGKPVAEVIPATGTQGRAEWLGSMKEKMEIVGDLVSPASVTPQWEAVRD